MSEPETDSAPALPTPEPVPGALESTSAPLASPAPIETPTPEGAVANISEVVPQTPTTVAPGAPPQTAIDLVAKAAQVFPPAKVSSDVKTSTTVAQGRKAVDVEKQVATDKAALGGYAQGVDERAKQADEKALAAQDQSIATQRMLQAHAVEEGLRAQQVKDEAARRAAAWSSVPEGKLDPDQFMASLSTGSKIGMTVLAMLSGAFSGAAGKPNENPFLDSLTRRINEDVAIQKDQIEQGRIRRNNGIARAMADGATAEQALTAAKAQLWNGAVNVAMLQADRLKLEGAQRAVADQQIAVMQYQAGIHEGDLRATEENRIHTTREEERKAATGGAGGANPELQKKAWEAYDQAVNAGQDRTTAYRESGLAQLGVSQPTGASKEDRAAAEKTAEQQTKAGERTEDQAKTAGVLTAVANKARALGYVRGDDGQWTTGGKRGSVAQNKAANTAYETALRASGYDKDAVKEATKEPGGIGSKILDAIPFGFLFSSDTTPDDVIAQLNALESTSKQRLSQRDRGGPQAGAPEVHGFKPMAAP